MRGEWEPKGKENEHVHTHTHTKTGKTKESRTSKRSRAGEKHLLHHTCWTLLEKTHRLYTKLQTLATDFHRTFGAKKWVADKWKSTFLPEVCNTLGRKQNMVM